MRIETDVKLDFKDVLIRPKRSTLTSRAEVELEREYKFRYGSVHWKGVPIIAANMDHTGTLNMARALTTHKLMTAVDKFVPITDWEKFAKENKCHAHHTFITAGLKEEDFKQLKDTMNAIDFPFICLDVANGYTQRFVDCVKRIRAEFPHKVIMAGNVVTGEMTEELILAGADIVKVGIGPGSVCTTRKKTGVGYPQLSAVIECADSAHGLKGLVCADGGCTTPGDVAKAFAAGADFVMLGGMFAGHQECNGEMFEDECGQKKMRFYGMSSSEAMKKHHGKIAGYRSAEGKSVDIPYRGAVEDTILDILGGLRSTCTYVGAQHLKELSKRTTFIQVTQQLNEVYAAHEVD
jgi:GMP reductase